MNVVQNLVGNRVEGRVGQLKITVYVADVTPPVFLMEKSREGILVRFEARIERNESPARLECPLRSRDHLASGHVVDVVEEAERYDDVK